MLGSRTQLALQRSRGDRSLSERAIATALAELGVDHRQGAFETIMINDEYVWESYGIPTASINRFPYPEYHSSRDNAAIISEPHLEEAVTVMERAIEWLDRVPIVERLFDGTVCLSNPHYDLYIDPGQIAFGDIAQEDRRRLRYLQDVITTLSRPTALPDLAQEAGLSEQVAEAYLGKWQAKGLIRIS
jgi:hypothetical protein